MKINDLIGCKYLSGGRTPQEGLDCYGLAILAVKIITGKNMPDAFYNDTDVGTKKRLFETLEVSIPNRRINKPEAGALVGINELGQPAHIGVCLGDGTFIHSTKKTGVVIEPLYRYNTRIRGYYHVND